MSSIKAPAWAVFDFLGVIVPLGVRSGLSYMGVHTKHSVDPEMINLMRELQSQGIGLALASNSGKPWIESVWKKIEDAPKIDKIITPEMGAAKPAAAYFSHVIEELNAKPEEIFFLDDRQANCIGAEGAGIRAIWYQGDIAALRDELNLK